MSDPRRLIPFGKYKGQPIEVLAADREYLEWLQAQPWFPERFPQIHTLIVNNFGEPENTPEHNRLQVEFLDPAIQRSIWSLAFSRESEALRVEIEPIGFDVRVSDGRSSSVYIECKPTIGEDFPVILRKIKTNIIRVDDYHCGRIALVFDQFTCKSATISQIENAFRTSRISMLPISEVRANALKFRGDESCIDGPFSEE